LFIAAPPLVRAMFHLPTPGTTRTPKIRAVQESKTPEVVAK